VILRRASDVEAGNTVVTEKFPMGVLVDAAITTLVENVAYTSIYFRISTSAETFVMKFKVSDYLEIVGIPMSLASENT
jgi:hypothetical protein